ncbi:MULTISPECIES: alanyl-tRNA editing protein [Arthrobacter]|uniref:Alanyl-tRNA editing protein n=2 Tax=Arthrobacter TaxID=1663 RepID=A0ABU9KQT4_9MICC|nr:alanyl-tRNA editing protein [Arthrobacter sp. YJM1]MDP5228190.1 alanyl-tRNA editing protein [Arthrobacter sp. YJM1]
MSISQDQAYYRDTYLFATEATVVADGRDEDGAWVALSPNIFHPKGGGQPSDEGTVGGTPVTPSRTEDGLVILSAADDAALPAVGAQVGCAVDPERRLRHAALHTAGHVLGHLGESRGWQSTGHSHYPGQARLDFDPEGLEAELATPELRDAVRAELQAALDSVLATGGAVTASMDDAGHRTVTIAGVNSEPCGGTHVASLADLRDVKILELKVKRGALKVRYEAEHA